MIKLLWIIAFAYGYSSRSFCVELNGSVREIPNEAKGQEKSEVKIYKMTVITPGADDKKEYDLIEAFEKNKKEPPIQKHESMNQQEVSQSNNDIVLQDHGFLNQDNKFAQSGELNDEQKAMEAPNKISYIKPKENDFIIEESFTPSEKKTSYPVDIKIRLGIPNHNATYDICRDLFKPFAQGEFNNNKLLINNTEFTVECCFVMCENKPLTSNYQPSKNFTPPDSYAFIHYKDSNGNLKTRRRFTYDGDMILGFININKGNSNYYAFVPIRYKEEMKDKIRLIL